jgi:hypothetical protein
MVAADAATAIAFNVKPNAELKKALDLADLNGEVGKKFNIKNANGAVETLRTPRVCAASPDGQSSKAAGAASQVLRPGTMRDVEDALGIRQASAFPFKWFRMHQSLAQIEVNPDVTEIDQRHQRHAGRACC